MIECRDCHERFDREAYEWHAKHPACCIEVLKAKLASMTKRAEEAERENVDHVKVRTCAGCGGYLCPPLHCYACQKYKPDQMAIDLAKKCDAAEAKLAMAVEVLKAASVWANSNKVFYHHVGGPGCTGDVLHELGMTALGALRALGIDPSKERGK